MKRQIICIITLGILSLAATAMAADVTLFQEDFEAGNRSHWTGDVNGPHDGQIVADPLQPGNHVVHFTALDANGNLFTVAHFPVSDASRQYVVRFDYLGLAQAGSVAGNLGGFIGVAASVEEWQTGRYWIAGTDVSGINAPGGVELIDDGAWHHYEIDISALVQQAGLTNVHLMLEDWNESLGVPGDAYFDNIELFVRGEEFSLEDFVPCAGPLSGGAWKNHGEYVSTVAKVTRELVRQGVVSRAERAALVREAAQSSCGKKEKKK